jgi:hypothetical protein
MSEQATIAESSPAEVADAFNGENVSLADFSRFRRTGEVPERYKAAENADSATADSSEAEKAESASESETGEQQQEKRKGKSAEDRIAQLESTIEKIKRGAGLERKTEVAAVTEQPKAPQNYAEYRKGFKPSQWVEEYGKQNPDASYEDATAAMADHLADVRDQFRSFEQQRQSQAKELNEKVTDARSRYGESFDDVLAPTVNTILGDPQIPAAVKVMLNESDDLPSVIFTIGSDQKTLDEFMAMAKTSPGKALRYIAAVEQGIADELSDKGTDRDTKGQFVAKEPPAKPKTSAPKPPSPVSGASSGAFDVSDESLSAEEWARQRNTQLAKRRG